MTKSLHQRRFPNETQQYREARDDLLRREMALRDEIEAIAAQRRALPLGGEVPEDYEFEGPSGPVKLSGLFGDKDVLVIYHLMFGPEREAPCGYCSSMLDALCGNAQGLSEQVALHVVAKSPFERLAPIIAERGWEALNLLSSAGSSFNRDYLSEIEEGVEVPMFNIFSREGDAIHHRYGGELFFVPPTPGKHPRGVDLIWPRWNVLDLTPNGRGETWP